MHSSTADKKEKNASMSFEMGAVPTFICPGPNRVGPQNPGRVLPLQPGMGMGARTSAQGRICSNPFP